MPDLDWRSSYLAEKAGLKPICRNMSMKRYEGLGSFPLLRPESLNSAIDI